jgi:cell division protein FtsQ
MRFKFASFLRGLGIVAVLLAALGAGLYSWDVKQTLFPIKQIEWSPQVDPAQTAEIEKVVALYKGQSFWQADLLTLQSNLVRLEWVRSASISRVWPETLKIQLVLQKPVARWGERGLVNEVGQVFYPLDIAPYENLVALNGEEVNAPEVLKALVAFQAILQPLDFKIKTLSQMPSGDWKIELLSGKVIWLGEKDAKHSLQRFVLAYPKVAKSERKLAHGFDLRYSNGFSIYKSEKTNQSRKGS